MAAKNSVRWQWWDEHKFVDFDTVSVSTLEKAFASKSVDEPVKLVIGGGAGKKKALQYTVDLKDSWVQTNTQSKKHRVIRRVGANGEVDGNTPVWEWEQKKSSGVFTPYDRFVSETIHMAHVNNELTVKVKVASGAHDTIEVVIHFGHMHQHHKETDTTRKIRSKGMKVVHLSGGAGTTVPSSATSSTSVMPKKREISSPTATRAPTKKRARSPTIEEEEEEDGAMVKKKATTVAAPSTVAVCHPPLTAAAAAAVTSSKDHTMMELMHCSSLSDCLHVIVPGSKKKEEEDRVAAPSFPLKIAAFDMDDCLVVPKGGKKFAQGRKDWEWIHPNVVPTLTMLHNEGYRLVLFTNQLGIEKGHVTAADTMGKIEDLSEAAGGLPLTAMLASREDQFRKPSSSMWYFYVRHFVLPSFHGKNEIKEEMKDMIDMDASFYCGDAAGRSVMTMAGRKKDHSCSDRKFAYNIGVKFLTPEQLFLKKWGEGGGERKKVPFSPVSVDNDDDVVFDWEQGGGISPKELMDLATAYPSSSAIGAADTQEMIIFTGYPGCGKSTFYTRYLKPKGYTHINRDTLKTPARCLQEAEKALKSGKSVAIDNTSPQVADRAPYLALAKKCNIPVRSFVFTASKAFAWHLNLFRARLGISPRVSSVAYNVFKGKFQKPSCSEGFATVAEIPPVANFDGLSEEAKHIFYELS